MPVCTYGQIFISSHYPFQVRTDATLLLLPPIPPSITVFPNESTLHMRWPKYWSLSFSISPSNEHPGLIFRMNWLVNLPQITKLISSRTKPRIQVSWFPIQYSSHYKGKSLVGLFPAGRVPNTSLRCGNVSLNKIP